MVLSIGSVRNRRGSAGASPSRGAFALLCFLVAGCGSSCQKGSGPQTPDAAARPVTILVSCDTAGWIVPCGCSTKQAGGLLRRASYAGGLRKDREVVLLDAGGAPGGKSPYDRAKFEAVLRGEVLMGVAAHNIGAAEAELGWADLETLATGTRAAFVASNVAAPVQGKGVEIPRTRVIAAGGMRIGVLGVLSPSLAPSDWTVTEPREAILAQLPALKAEKVDQIMVLAYLPEEELAALAGQVPEVDLVIGGPTRQSIAPKKTGPTVWGSATNKGKFLVRLDRETAATGWEGRIVELDESIPDEKEQTANLQTFRDELLRVDFAADQTSFVPPLGANLPTDFRVVGTEQCRACHAADCWVWEESGHARGWETLVGKGAQMDPYCQQCHTTGYGLPGGFASLKSPAALTNIGCESCHGPGQAHASRPATRTLYRAQDRCTACHDHDNSPEFQYAAYWARIEHGRPAAAGEGK